MDMDIPFFLRGLIIGFSIAAPVGPIGLLCIQRTLAYGRITGFVSDWGRRRLMRFMARLPPLA